MLKNSKKLCWKIQKNSVKKDKKSVFKKISVEKDKKSVFKKISVEKYKKLVLKNTKNLC